MEDLEEVHQSSGDVFWLCQAGGEWEPGEEEPFQFGRVQGMRIGGVITCGVSTAEESTSDGIEVEDMEFVEIAFGVDEDGALIRLFGEDVVSNAVMGKVVEHFQG